MADHITHDPIYNSVERDDFPAMIDVDRYGERTDAFDKIVASTHDHFWDPTDPAYLDFTQPFDLTQQTVVPRSMTVELNCAVADRLDERQQIRLANQSTRFMLSSILHGEQGALSLSASLCMILRDAGAQEYAANQTREEARHVTAFAKYIATRWGTPLPAGQTLKNLMTELVLAPEVYKKLIGMQLVMTDEAFHHQFGKIWADRTVPKLTEAEHEKVEQWAAQCFQTLLFNLVNAEQKQVIYGEFGLDWRWVRSAVMESFTDSDRRRLMTESTNIFRVLIKTLLKAGIITERTKSTYAMWVDMDELAREADEVVGTDVAEDGIAYLRDINKDRKRIGRALRAAS